MRVCKCGAKATEKYKGQHVCKDCAIHYLLFGRAMTGRKKNINYGSPVYVDGVKKTRGA